MEKFQRCNPLFSLCGLNCGLCSMYLDKYCPGCGGGSGNQPCAIARCSQQRGGIEYCYLCDDYPCEKYDGIDAFDSFITHRNQLNDLKKARKMGIDAYQSELAEKMLILKHLLENYNDGRRKSFFCIAVNLLELQDIKYIMEQIAKIEPDNLTPREKAALAANLFQTMATNRNVVLKLNKKTKIKA